MLDSLLLGLIHIISASPDRQNHSGLANVSIAAPSPAFPRPPRWKYRAIQIHLTTLLFCLISAAAVHAQDPTRGWQWQNPLPQGNSINSIRFTADKRYGWATGGDGVVLRTENGGFDWEPQETPANSSLYAIYVKDKSRVVISGARGVILTTTNGGSRWVLRQTGTRDHLFGVTFAPGDPLRGWAVGTFGVILVTNDGGLTWKEQTSHTTAHLFSV